MPIYACQCVDAMGHPCPWTGWPSGYRRHLEAAHSVRPLHILYNTRTGEIQGADKGSVALIFELALWTRDLFCREYTYSTPGRLHREAHPGRPGRGRAEIMGGPPVARALALPRTGGRNEDGELMAEDLG